MLRGLMCSRCKYWPRASALLGGACTAAGLVVWAIYTLWALQDTRDVVNVTDADLAAGDFVDRVVDAYNIVVIVMCSVTSVVLLCIVVFSGYMRGMARDKLTGRNVKPSKTLQVSQCSLQWLAFLLLVVFVLLSLVDAAWLVAAAVTKYSAKTASTTFTGIVEAVGAEKPEEAERVQQILEQDSPTSSSGASSVESLLGRLGPRDLNTNVARVYTVYLREFVGDVEVQSSVEQLGLQLNDTTLNNLYQVAEDADRLSEFSGIQVCPTNICMDLSIYDFLGTDLCLCDPFLILLVQDAADSAEDNLIMALVGNCLLVLGQSLLFCAVTAHSAQLVFMRRQLKAESRQSSRSIPEVRVLPSAPPSSGFIPD